MKPRVVLALCGLSALFLLSAVDAQEPAKEEAEKKAEETKEAPKGPQLDDLSRQLLESWDKSTYHLGRLGVKKASCTVKVSVTSPMGPANGKFTYRWDGEKGQVAWENPQAAAMIDRENRTRKGLDGDFKHEPIEQQLGAAKCTAKATESGHIVTVEGKSEMGIKSLTFDQDGVLTQVVMEMMGQMGPQKITMGLTYTKVDGKYLLSSQKADIEAGMGMVQLVNKFTYTKVGDHQVKQKQVTNISVGGNPMSSKTMEFSDWKLNEAVDAPAVQKPAQPKEDGEDEEGEEEDEDEDEEGEEDDDD